MTHKIIIDCDPGIDDAMALLYAIASEDIEILAVHTVAGNVNVDHTTNNAQGVLAFLNRHDIPICRGSNMPLVENPSFADDVHGVNGMNGYEFDSFAPLSEKTALESYVAILRNTSEKVTIAAVGPLTNVAILLKGYPELTDKIEKIIIMGGGLKGGNITTTGEFNFYVDPHAAHIVINSGLPIVLAGLDVTEVARLHKEDLEEIASHDARLGQFLLTINENSLSIYNSLGFGKTCTPNDVVPLVHLLHPEVFETQDLKIDVSYDSSETRGMTYLDSRIRMPQEPNVQMIMDVDLARFRAAFKATVIKYVQNSNNH
ncbi:nucleoside hydrolase [Jeotgalibaca sp. A127]|uniref:nucleoside hydrolase n=1 Tax=Jeotgalibaca sp. A127 TaxID=3457324 RepID=UPI003FD26C55